MTSVEPQAQPISSSSPPPPLAQQQAQLPPPKPKAPAPPLPEAHTGALAQVAQMALPPDTASTQHSDAQTVAQVTQKAALPGEAQPGASAHAIQTKAPPSNISFKRAPYVQQGASAQDAQMALPPDTASTQDSDAQTVAQVTQKAALPVKASTQLGEVQPAHAIRTKAPPSNISFTQAPDVQQGASAQVACPPPPPPARALAGACQPPPPPATRNNSFNWGPYKGKSFEDIFCNQPEFVGQCLRTGVTQEAWLQFMQQKGSGSRIVELEQSLKELKQNLVERDQRIAHLETKIASISAICNHA